MPKMVIIKMKAGEFPPDEENIVIDIKPKMFNLMEHIMDCNSGEKKKDDIYWTYIKQTIMDEIRRGGY